MQVGDVLYFGDFVFKDGGHADKLLVVLAIVDGEALMVIGTSKGKQTNPGCQPTPKKFFLKAGNTTFPKDTWLDLARTPTVSPVANLEQAIQLGKISLKKTLSQQLVNEIKNCLKKHAVDSLDKTMCKMLGVTPRW